MQIRDRDEASSNEGSQAIVSTGGPRKRRSWLAGVGAFVVVLLVIGASIVVFSVLGQRHGSTQGRSSGQWQQVQQGYLFLSIVAAPNDPAVLYACATTSAAVSNQDGPGTVTILRSADLGDHWQNVGAHVVVGDACEVAINSGNSNDIYTVSISNTSQISATLQHSTDGGQTWETIVPNLLMPEGAARVPWFVQQLRVEGNNLYGVQWQAPTPVFPPSPSRVVRSLSRLVMSSDGGHTWSIIDNQFVAQGLGSQRYVLDPAHPGTAYEIVGKPWLPVESTEPYDSLPSFATNEALYKTTDNGASWQLLLQSLPFGSQVQIASSNPQILYVGGTVGPLPLRAQTDQAPPTFPISAFRLQVSRDGGATWKLVANAPGQASIQDWFVSADGHVYASPTMTFSVPGGQATAVPGTAVPPVRPTIKVGTGNDAAILYPEIQTASDFILRYDPGSNSWSQVTAPPANGQLVAVTPGNTNGGLTLWFMGMLSNGKFALYRYVV